jgi:hypothetical protein
MAEKMTLAQGLRLCKKLKGEIAKQAKRIEYALVYDAEKLPTFTYEEAMKGHAAAQARLVRASTEMACANALTKVDWEGGICLAQAIRLLQELKGDLTRHQAYLHTPLLNAKEITYEKDEPYYEEAAGPHGVQNLQKIRRIKVRRICNLTMKDCEARIEELQAQFEKLNNLVEKANHQTLIEV